jgi:hypothetical protein
MTSFMKSTWGSVYLIDTARIFKLGVIETITPTLNIYKTNLRRKIRRKKSQRTDQTQVDKRRGR